MFCRIFIVCVASLVASCATTDNSENQLTFLAENAAREGVVVTPSGLQFEVLKLADGPKPTELSKVTVHYVGTLINGEEFDSTRKRGDPPSFVLGGVIQGLLEGLQLMSAGSQYRFVVPAGLAYADRGNGSQIRPGATLIYDVELLEIATE